MQVNKNHYNFKNYMSKERWSSIWEQLNIINELEIEDLLELGPGVGYLKKNLELIGVQAKTMDYDPALNPDYVRDLRGDFLLDRLFDAVCAFQVLEHFEYDKSIELFKKMSLIAKRYLIISLPNKVPLIEIKIPKSIKRDRPFARRFNAFFYSPKDSQFDGEHYWELGDRGITVESTVSKFEKVSGFHLIKEYRNNENIYHHFMIFKKGFSDDQ
jgi:hypothetical protein